MDVVTAMRRATNGEVDVSNTKVWGHFHQMSNPGAVDSFCQHSSIFYATVAAGDMLYLPPGYVISEGTMDGKNIYGLRVPVLHLGRGFVPVWRIREGARGKASSVRFCGAFSCESLGVPRGVACSCLPLPVAGGGLGAQFTL